MICSCSTAEWNFQAAITREPLPNGSLEKIALKEKTQNFVLHFYFDRVFSNPPHIPRKTWHNFFKSEMTALKKLQGKQWWYCRRTFMCIWDHNFFEQRCRLNASSKCIWLRSLPSNAHKTKYYGLSEMPLSMAEHELTATRKNRNNPLSNYKIEKKMEINQWDPVLDAGYVPSRVGSSIQIIRLCM